VEPCCLELRDCATKISAGIAAPDAGSELKDPIGRAKPTLEAISGDAAPPSHLFKPPSPRAAVLKVFV